MDKEKLRLINILKSVPEIKESIEELNFGCIVQYDYVGEGDKYYGKLLYSGASRIGTRYKVFFDEFNSRDIEGRYEKHEIIGQIHEGHLNMFMNEKGIFFCMGNWYFIREGGIDRRIVEKDNTKDLMNQSEDFYKKLNDWMCKEFKLEITK